MRDDTPMGHADEAEAAERTELARQIDGLMAAAPKRWPAIFVVGDEAVFGITPAKRAA